MDLPSTPPLSLEGDFSDVPGSSNEPSSPHDDRIAIIGIGCRLPGAISNTSQLWEFLSEGRSANGELPSSRFNIHSYHGDKDEPSSTAALGGYFLQDDIRNFDNQFFGINNREASTMDPQQRKLLEVVYEALENAGVSMAAASGSNTGCYVASFTPDFISMQTKDVESLTRYSQVGMGTTILANRISHVFNLKGPSCVLDTACSSSIYALHAACSALQGGECDSAVVAGVNLIQVPEMHVAISQAGVISSTSTCHTFDASADGYGRADGVNALVIKRLDDALRDGDPIRSVIRATAVNSNGHTPGITQPSIDGQKAVIRKAYARAGLSPYDTPYVEAHGTGTSVGDPIEVEAISSVFHNAESSQPTLLGSVKTNFGHGEAASGLTSVIKATLALEKGQIPATIGVKELNPKLKCNEWGVDIVRNTVPFPERGLEPRRISVNSFGYGGANAHVILEAAEARNNKLFVESMEQLDSSTNLTYLLPLSGNKMPSLYGRIEDLAKLNLSSVSLSDLAYTLGERRSHMPLRGYILAKDGRLAQDMTVANLRMATTEKDLSGAEFAFVFTGQGAQWQGMARELIQFKTFRRSIQLLDEYLACLPNAPSWRIQDVLMDESENCLINQAAFAQPITSAVQIGLVNLLREWSIYPQATIGHSSGEIGAAYCAGLLTAKEAITIAYYRGYVVSRATTKGSMAAVGLGAEDIRAWIKKLGLEKEVEVACINSPKSVTISGETHGIQSVSEALKNEGVFVRGLHTDGRAYHSQQMHAVGMAYEELIDEALALNNTSAPKTARSQAKMTSTVMCKQVGAEEVRMASYWRTNLEAPVRFSQGLSSLSESHKGLVFVEVGPHAALKMPILDTLGSETTYFSTLSRKKDSSESLLSFVGDLFVHHFPVDFAALNKAHHVHHAKRPRVVSDLPTYPWRYEDDVLWTESRVSREGRFRRYPRHELLGSEIPGGNKSTLSWRNNLHLNDVPWLRDHKLEETVVFPAAGYIAMAVEAMRQTVPPSASPTSGSIVIRQMDLLKALPLADDESIELMTELRPMGISNVTMSSTWWEVQITSISDDVGTVRARGTVGFQQSHHSEAMPLPSSSARVAPQSKRLWYEGISKSGLGFGPTFQHMDEVYTADPKGEKYAEARTKSLNPEIEGSQSQARYVIHPTLLDSLFQVGLVASTGGHVQSMVAKVPTRISRIRLDLSKTAIEGPGVIRSTSEATGFFSDRLNSALYDEQEQPVAHFFGADITTFSSKDQAEDRQPLFRVGWKPDIGKITDASSFDRALGRVLSVTELGLLGSKGQLLAAIDLAVHKNPDMDILWLSEDHVLAALALVEVLSATSQHQRFGSFSLGRSTAEGELEVAELNKFTIPFGLGSLRYRKSTPENKYGLVVLPEDISVLDNLGENITDQALYLRAANSESNTHSLSSNMSVISSSMIGDHSVQLIRPLSPVAPPKSPINHILHICGSPIHPRDAEMKNHLAQAFGAHVQQLTLGDLVATSIPAGALVISTIEVDNAVLDEPGSEEFEGIKQIIEQAAQIVWVTGSGSHDGFNPTLSLFPGLARAIMIEQPSTKIFSLELDPQSDAASVAQDILRIVDQGEGAIIDYEYIRDRSGLLISRVVPDVPMNQHFRQRQESSATMMPLSKAGHATLSLRKPGQLSTAQFVMKDSLTTKAPPADSVTVKVHSVGLNAKDVYALAGRVATTDASCSLEYTGFVTEIGSEVTDLSIGDKVAVMYPSHFGTFETVPSWSCVKLSDDEDMASMASVLVIFVTAIYALHHRAHLQPGESILIHSAAGGVGLATIQMAKLIGAEVFATVGAEEKKQYLIDHYGLQADHIFDSRNAGFVSGIKAATGGRGVDVILNSLVGELLHESWDCLADFGRFVEIGKRDILDCGRLNMEGFARSTTFTAFDLSMLAESKAPAHHRLHQKMLSQVLTLLREGSIKPVTPLSVFGVADVASAFNYFNSSKRIGKIVISFEDQTQLVPVVPDKFSTVFDPNKSYLLVGCLGGLGRSLSHWMLERGARKFVFIGRTGTDKPAAKRLIDDLELAGAQCVVVKGDTTNYNDVVQAISAAPSTLGGVVQAAMGLNEAIFKAMSREHWLNGTEAKVRGTWNLHNALSELGKEKDLDFFILTSSISGKVGTATESNYCAANNFLDVFARYRRSLGLTAVSLGLGMISEVGYLHENPHIEDLLLRKGVRPILEDELLQIFDLGLTNPPTAANPKDLLSHPHLLTGLEVTGLVSQHKQGYEGYWQFLDDARFSVLTSALKRTSAGKTAQVGSKSQLSAINDALSANDEEALIFAVKDVVAKKLSNLILLPVDKLDPKTPLADFGMDSMLAAELRQYIFGVLGADVLLLTLMDTKQTLCSLSTLIAQTLRSS